MKGMVTMKEDKKVSKWQLEMEEATAFWDEEPKKSNMLEEQTTEKRTKAKTRKEKTLQKGSGKKKNTINSKKEKQAKSLGNMSPLARVSQEGTEEKTSEKKQKFVNDSEEAYYQIDVSEAEEGYGKEFLQTFRHILSDEMINDIMKEILGTDYQVSNEVKLKNHRKRQKDVFAATGLQAWPEHHILEFLLYFAIPRKDTRDIGRELISQFHNLQGVFDAPVEALLQIKGIGPHSALLIKFVGAVHVKVLESQTTVKITSTEAAYESLYPHFMQSTVESSKVMCLDGDRNLLAIRDLGEGNIYSTPTDIRRIVQSAVNTKAVYLYLAHNHISSPFEPSLDDWHVTEEISKILAPLQLHLMDHIIIGKNHGEMTSLRRLHTSPKYQIHWGQEYKKSKKRDTT